MRYLFNDPSRKSLRRKLRGDLTDVEKILWGRFRNNQLGVKFYRQYGIGPYVVDFYCPAVHLAIELDGGQHAEEASLRYDKDRDAFLRGRGIRVARFWNNDVNKSLDEVLEEILNVVDHNSPYPPLS